MVNLNFFLASAPELTNWIGKLIYGLYNAIGNFGWTVVVFTIILKTILSPLDFWQKHVTRKNNKAMKRMAPEIEKLKKQCGDDQQAFQQKQMALYKKEGYSMWGSCLPTIVTMVIFFVVFAGFNACVRYENETLLHNMTEYYTSSVASVELTEAEMQNILGEGVDINGTLTQEQYSALVVAKVAKQDELMLAKYNELAVNHKWLWIKNVFVSDNWSNRVPDLDKYVGQGLGKIGGTLPDNLVSDVVPDGEVYMQSYDSVMGAAIKAYNKTGESSWKTFWDLKNWNGYVVLPILAVLLSIVSNKLLKGSTPEQPPQYDSEGKPVKNNMAKYMMWFMPIMIGVFSIFYSAAFSIYMFFNSLFTVCFNLVYNLITKKKDKLEEEGVVTTSARKR